MSVNNYLTYDGSVVRHCSKIIFLLPINFNYETSSHVDSEQQQTNQFHFPIDPIDMRSLSSRLTSCPQSCSVINKTGFFIE